MKRLFCSNPIWMIQTVLVMLPAHCVFGMYLFNRTQTFMFWALAKAYRGASPAIDLHAYAADSKVLTYLFVAMFVAEVALLLFFMKSVATRSAAVKVPA